MNTTVQSMIQPKFVALDTSTWIDLFKHRTDPEVKDVIDVLNSGQIISYISFDHVCELLQHSVQKVRLQQLEFFGLIKLMSFSKPISFPAPWRNSPLCGSFLDVQESEISILLRNPTFSLEQVIERVRSEAVAGLSMGVDLANDTVLADIARSGRAIGIAQLNRAAASVIHSSPFNPNEIIPKAGDYTTSDDFVAETLFRSRMALHDRRMQLPDGTAYLAIKMQKFPSMVTWFALERVAKPNEQTADGGNMTDFPLAALALYIDKVQVDKRVLHHVEVAARNDPFLDRIRTNVFRAKDLKSLLGELNSL